MKLKLFLVTCVFASHACLANVDQHFKTIQSSPNALYAFLKAMPKGGELHYHLAGSAYPETMLNIAEDKPYCLELNTSSIKTTGFCNEGLLSRDLPARPKVYEQYLQAWSMKNFVPGKESSHDHFFNAFDKFMPIINEHRGELLAKIMQRAANQNEHYLEIMANPDNSHSLSFAKLLTLKETHQDKLRALKASQDFENNVQLTVKNGERVLNTARQLLACDKNPQSKACQVKVKFQYYILRELPQNAVFAMAVNAFEVATRSENFVGINLVQPEDSPSSIKNYGKQMKLINFMHQQYPEVNIALHAGEITPTVVTPQELRYHISDAIVIGRAQRIGHGVDIGYETDSDKIMQKMAKEHIAVEINLTSNRWILGVYGKAHPLRYYLENQVPVVLSTDDEGILRTDLTTQYVKAVEEHGLNYSQLKTISRNALTYSFLSGKSLWENAANAARITACQDIESATCKQFLINNEKAREQQRLELAFKQFESNY